MPFYLKRRPKGHPLRHHGDGLEVHRARVRILRSLLPLIELAEQRGMNLHLACQGLTFTPDELREKVAVGRYMMGTDWWQLRQVRGV